MSFVKDKRQTQTLISDEKSEAEKRGNSIDIQELGRGD